MKYGKQTLGIALAAALAAPGAALALDGVKIDLDGPNAGATSIISTDWTWAFNTFLCQGCITSKIGSATTVTEGVLYGQGNVLAMGPNGGSAVDNFTFEFRLPVKATHFVGSGGLDVFSSPPGTNDTVTLEQAASEDFGAGNYFRIFYNPTFVNTEPSTAGDNTDIERGTNFGSSTGTEEADATDMQVNEVHTILDAKVTFGSGNFVSLSGPSTFNMGDQATADSRDLAGTVNLNVNVCTAKDAALPECVGGNSFFDTDFWIQTVFDGFNINATVNGALKAPFEKPGEPDGPPVPNKVVGNTPDLGNGSGTQDTDDSTAINALRCNTTGFAGTPDASCDVVLASLKVDTRWTAKVVSSPETLALLGLGLLGAGVASRRRRLARAA